MIDRSTFLLRVPADNDKREHGKLDSNKKTKTQESVKEDFASKMAQAADFRNRVVHGYNDFDFRLIFKDLKINIGDLRRFGSEILNI